MALLKLFVFTASCCIVGLVMAATDYVFADSFETILCNGVGCSYCSPANPLPLCGSGSHCSPQDGASVCSHPAGTGSSGATCSALADCAGPLACVNTGISTTCQNWCTYPGGSCPAAQTCFPFNLAAMIGATEWGICY